MTFFHFFIFSSTHQLQIGEGQVTGLYTSVQNNKKPTEDISLDVWPFTLRELWGSPMMR